MRFLMKDNKFEYWKAKLLNHVDGLIKKEEKPVKKSFSDYVDYILKSADRGHLVPKKITATNPKTGKTYTTTVYVNPNKKDGKKIYHSESKGARISLGKLKKRLEKCANSKELMQLVLENRDRFSDENGKPLPMIQEFSKYVSKLNDDFEAKENEKNIDSEIKNKLTAYMEKYPATFGKYSVNIENGRVSLEKDGKKYSRSFRYKDGVKDGSGDDWNEGALGNLVVYARQEDKEAEEKREAEDTTNDKEAEKNNDTEQKTNENQKDTKQESIERMNGIIDAKAKEYASDSYTKYAAEDRVKRLGKAKLEQYASLKLKSDEEFLQSLKEKVAGLDEEVSEYTLATAVWNHYVKKYARDWAQNKLKSMEQNESSITEPIEEKDMNEAVDIIGSDVRRILDGRDTYGNAKQGLVDKIKRRIRNNPGVARAMLTYIKQEQEKSGKTVFTAKHSIWEELPKLNEAARKAHESGESETKTGVTGSLYEGEDGTTIVENKDWGRYQISFPGKPDSETISTLKHNGFRWSPKTQTWVGYNTSNGEYSMKRVAEKLGLKKTEGIQKSFFGDIESSMPYSDEIDDEAETDGEEETFESVAKKNRQALEDWKKQQDIQKSVTDILNNL